MAKRKSATASDNRSANPRFKPAGVEIGGVLFPRDVWDLINEFRRKAMEKEMGMTIYVICAGRLECSANEQIFTARKYSIAVKKASQIMQKMPNENWITGNQMLLDSIDDDDDDAGIRLVASWMSVVTGGTDYVQIYRSFTIDSVYF